MDMEISDRMANEDLKITAIMLLVINIGLVLISSVTHLIVKTPWPQILFLQFVKAPVLAFWIVLVNSQPLFSPLLIVLIMLILPLFLHIMCLLNICILVRNSNIKTRILYIFISIVPVFGPLAAQIIMNGLGDLED